MRLLVVEDQPKVAAGAPARAAGRATRSTSPPTASRRCSTRAVHAYDAVLLDVLLPARDGVAVCRALRERGGRAPVLMLTALGAVEDRIRGLDAGADDYLGKPFDFGELLARVRALVRRGPSGRPAQLRVGALRIDPARHAVELRGDPVALSAREFALLEYLAGRPGDVVSRTELLDHVWDANYAGSTNIVDVYVGRLRRKLDPPRDAPLIRTVRGVGFALDPPP